MLVGIDLGTTYSLISRVGKNGIPVLIPDNHKNSVFTTPSIIHIDGDTAYIGEFLETKLERNPGLNLIKFFKRHFGENKALYYDRDGTPWYPEGLAALLLKKLIIDAEAYTTEKIEGAVITVPAHFTDVQRKAVLNAAALIDLPVLNLLEEPIAAAMHYGLSNKKYNKTIMVYDLGGGTFDVTIMTMDQNGIYVIAKDGHTEIGGKEFDEKIGEIILNQFKEAYGKEPVLDARNALHLRRFSEMLKVELCMPGTRFVDQVCVIGNQSLEVHVSRQDFEGAIESYLIDCEEILGRCLKSASLDYSDVDTLLLVGGSSMVPLIKKRLQKIFSDEHQEILTHEPMRAVAYGAALHAVQLSDQKIDFELPPELRGVTGYNLGVRAINPRTGRIVIDNMVKKNMPLPFQNSKTYYTSNADQKKMKLEIIQYINKGEKEVSLGTLVIGPLPSFDANYPIEVKIENRVDGTVWFSAFDPKTGIEIEKVFGDEVEGISKLPRQKSIVRSTYVNMIV
ncbi:Hsp70 family protein [Cecembia lonarensis]|uniref:Heat shock protein 70 n=1 Tax=Cecembia lonarensis (strain CCUG 58316 / KCTC 22772 / LW9) TaxID=1225176 RepID=K1M4E2_CECL9|nr:Hsp70 family protein [Cecembia lonarensis]EKB51124.1 Heat shock protein 70 [Cecembia lonarensis LW9]